MPIPLRMPEQRGHTGLRVMGKCVILSHEKNEGRIILILVKEALGY